jgi:hypothetical protein
METILANVTATAPAAPITVHYRDGTKREIHMVDGELNLGPEHLIERVVVATVSGDPVLSVGTIGEATD